MHNIVQQFINFFLNNFILKASPCLSNPLVFLIQENNMMITRHYNMSHHVYQILTNLNLRKVHDDYQTLQLYLILPYQVPQLIHNN